ncbi:MAG: COX15/CtaA family protein [Planctomycetota bacterium]
MRSERTCADILTLGFGTSVAMWALGFFCRIPSGIIGEDLAAPPPATDLASAGLVPASALFVLLVLCMLGGGFLAGRLTTRGWRGGFFAGTLSSALNLLVVIGALSAEERNTLAASAVFFVPGTLLAGALLGVCGAVVGGWRSGNSGDSGDRQPISEQPEIGVSPRLSPLSWRCAFTVVAVCATFLLILAGGLVTSLKAGLQVPDWPNSFGYLMFFYPLSKMSGGIYFEHCHRLLGTLVGLATLVLVVYTLAKEEGSWLRIFALGAFGLVLLQGLLGGLRVTGRLTLSAARTDMAPSSALAVAHGIVAQIFFCALVAWSAFNSRAWREPGTLAARTVRTDWAIHSALLALLFIQLAAGAVLRHTAHLLHLHVTLAALASLAGLAAAARAWGLYGQSEILRRLAKALLLLGGLQVLLGVCSLFTLGFVLERRPSMLIQVIVTCAHHTVGVLLLGCATLLKVWGRRVLAPEPQGG